MTDRTRRRILRVHGTLLLVLALGNAVMSTVGWKTGAGPLGFLTEHRMGHVGLLQAYLLAALLAATLLWGSTQQDPRPFNRIGALLHVAILPAYALHWDYFAEGAPIGSALRNTLAVHLLLLLAEAAAGLSPDVSSTPSPPPTG